MLEVRKRSLALYVDKTSKQWIVRDLEENFWSLSSTENPWDGRQLFTPCEDTELEPVPGHYKYVLGIPSGPKSGEP
jgi:hypothetical protein